MIRYLVGVVEELVGDLMVVQVGGVGVEVTGTRAALEMASPGESIRLPVYLSVSDNGISLYGFGDDHERRVFLLLLQASGVGCKMAMGILNSMDKGEVLDAIASGDVARISRAQGVGPKRAERICFELKDKVTSLGIPRGDSGALVSTGSILEALMGLGFSRGEAAMALGEVRSKGEDLPEDQLLLRALRVLQRR